MGRKKCAILFGTMLFLAILLGCILLKKIKINMFVANLYPVQGIDVSHYQGDIDWEMLENQGIDFAYVKATEGSSFVDERFTENWAGAGATAMKIGAYHFFSFDSEGETQAQNYIDTVGELSGKLLPVVYYKYLEGEFEEYPLWIRDVYLWPDIALKDKWILWQYSDTSVLKGYQGTERYIDRNAFDGGMEELNKITVPI